MTESRLRPTVVLWWGISLTFAGLLLTTLLPQVGYAVTLQSSSASGIDQGLLVILDLIVRLIGQVVPPLGLVLIGASVVMAYVGSRLGEGAPEPENAAGKQ